MKTLTLDQTREVNGGSTLIVHPIIDSALFVGTIGAVFNVLANSLTFEDALRGAAIGAAAGAVYGLIKSV